MKSCLVKAFRLSLKIRLCFSFKLRENPRVVFDVLYFIIIFFILMLGHPLPENRTIMNNSFDYTFCNYDQITFTSRLREGPVS